MSKRKSDCMRTLQEVRECGKEFLVPEDIKGLLNCDSQTIGLAARQNPAGLGFPVIVMGTRVRIPTAAFLKFCEGGGIGT